MRSRPGLGLEFKHADAERFRVWSDNQARLMERCDDTRTAILDDAAKALEAELHNTTTDQIRFDAGSRVFY